jgi:hypothetical protein
LKKKIVGIFVIMLMIFSAVTTVFYSNDGKVEASDGEQQSSVGVNLDFDWVWSEVKNFSWVVNRTDWSGEHNIPKGRSWATAGENYTIDNILIHEWRNFTNPAFEFQKLLIGPINDEPYNKRLYSNKIVINDFGLTTENPSETIPYSEMFPIGIGVDAGGNHLNDTYRFEEAKIKERDLFVEDSLGESYFTDRLNVPDQFLNTYTLVGGSAVYLDQNDEVPENQDGLVFIMKETQDCEDKLDNITAASACILIKDASFGYTYEQADEKQFSILRVNENDDNLSEVLSEIENGSVFFVDNLYDTDTLVFTNLSNDTCVPNYIWVNVYQRTAPSLAGGACYDFTRLIGVSLLWYTYQYLLNITTKGCKGFILSDFNDTHFMTHTTKGWEWFMKEYGSPYCNRWC